MINVAIHKLGKKKFSIIYHLKRYKYKTFKVMVLKSLVLVLSMTLTIFVTLAKLLHCALQQCVFGFFLQNNIILHTLFLLQGCHEGQIRLH
jgi:hypothetical protein